MQVQAEEAQEAGAAQRLPALHRDGVLHRLNAQQREINQLRIEASQARGFTWFALGLAALALWINVAR